MKLFVFIALAFGSAVAQAADTMGLMCSVEIDGKKLEISYSARKSQMELTRAEDGTLFGNSFGGTLIVNLDGVEILNRKADAAAEEFGVIIEGDQLVYANLDIEDSTRSFSEEEFFFITFGKSFDEASYSYTTDSSRKEIGGGRKFPKTFSANCRAF